MGVKGLWQLLLPIGRRISIETLEGQIYAVDASIWLVQFHKAMRDPQSGEVVPNAHLIGFLRRICKLIFHGIRPVFVFDGATPQIKLRELRLRRQRRGITVLGVEDEAGYKRAAKKILASKLKQVKVSEKKKHKPKFYDGEGYHSVSVKVSSKNVSDSENNHSAMNGLQSTNNHDAFSPQNHVGDENKGPDEKWTDVMEDDETADSSVIIPNDFEGDLDVEHVVSLPPDIQKAVIEKAKREQRLRARKEFMPVAGSAQEYSQTQLRNFLRSSHLNKKINQVGLETSSRIEKTKFLTSSFEPLKVKVEDKSSVLPLDNVGNDVYGRVKKRPNDASFVTGGFMPPIEMNQTHNMKENTLIKSETSSDEAIARALQVSYDDSQLKSSSRYASIGLSDDDDDSDTDEIIAEQESIMEQINAQTRTKDEIMHGKFNPPNYWVKRPKIIVIDEDNEDKVMKYGAIKSRPIDIESESDESNEVKCKRRGITCGTVDVRNSTNGEKTNVHSSNDEVQSGCKVPDTQDRMNDCHWEDVNEDEVCKEKEESNDNLASIEMESESDEDSRIEWVNGDAEEEEFENSMNTNIRVKTASSSRDSMLAETPDECADWKTSEKQLKVLNDHNNIYCVKKESSSIDAAQVHDVKELSVKNNVMNAEGQSSKKEKRKESTKIALSSSIDEFSDVDWDDGSDVSNAQAHEDCVDPAHSYNEAHESDECSVLESDDTNVAISVDERQVNSLSKKETQEALVKAQETAANLTNWAGRAVRRAIADHMISVKKTSPPSSSEEKHKQETQFVQKPHGVRDLQSNHDKSTSQYFAQKMSPAKALESNLEDIVEDIDREDRNHKRDVDVITDEMREEIIQMLDLFGIPYICAPAEAESQCVKLEDMGLVNGIITEDSDAFVFGAKKVLKNIFEEKKYVEVYRAEDALSELGLSRNQFIALAMLLGGDYTSGVRGVGIVNGMEIIQAFPKLRDDVLAGLQSFKEWLEGYELTTEKSSTITATLRSFDTNHKSAKARWIPPSDFPSDQVFNAYFKPIVDNVNEKSFKFEQPDERGLKSFLEVKLSWTSKECDQVLDPVLEKRNRRSHQTRLESYYMTYDKNIKFARVTSKRLREVVEDIAKPGTRNKTL